MIGSSDQSVSAQAETLLSERLRDCMVIRRDSYVRLRRAVWDEIQFCKAVEMQAWEGSVDACAAEDDLIEWQMLLKQLDDAFNAG